ncbi:MAG: hypothetical protein ACYDC1_06305 [Limisphaerales bacterium]
MSTPVASLRPALRALLDDTDAATYQWSDIVMDGAVNFVLNSGRVEGYETDGSQITPNIGMPGGTDPNAYALLLFRAVQVLVLPRSAAMHVRTRARSVTRGALSEWLRYLEREIHALESGTLFDSWETFIESTGGVL